MAQKRLLWQLFPSYLLITLFSLVAGTVIAYYIISDIYLKAQSADLRSRVYLVYNQVYKYLKLTQSTDLDSLCKIIGNRSETRLTVILPDGTVLADSEHDPTKMDNHAQRPEIVAALQGKVATSTRYSETIEMDLIYVAVPIYENNEIIGILRASVPLTFIEQTLQAIRIRIIYSVIVISIIVAVISLILSRNISKPLEDIKLGVEKFARGELSFRFEKSGSIEMAKLTEALNKMAAQLNDELKTIIQQKNEQKAVLESMVESVIAVDRQGKVINVNRAAAQIFRLNGTNAMNHPIEDVIKNKDMISLIRKTLDGNEPVEDEIYLSAEENYYLQVHGTVLKNAKENIIGAVIVLNDVTRLRRLEKVRRDFVANVSHEIRTPLTSIKGFAETLLDGAINDPKNAKDFIQIISNQSNRLNAIIEDLLILARLEQEDERAQLEFTEYSLNKVLNSAIKVCSPKAESKKVKLILKVAEEYKIKINADLLEQAIVNLIDNAVKFSPEKSAIDITAEKANSRMIISVSDHGVGIEKKHLPRIFERFYRVDKARSRSLGGTGLGLAIVKHIVQVHGGNVSVESKSGEGSKFSIYIPVS